MKKIILFLFFLFTNCIAFSQNHFFKYYNSIHLSRIIPTSDFGFVGIAASDSVFVHKFDSLGEIQWTKIFSYPGFQFSNPDLIELQNRYLFITSTFYQGNIYTCINLLLDSSGNLLYAHLNNDSLLGLVGFHIAGKTNDAGVILSGTRRLGTLGGASGFITKIDSTGNFEWSRYFFADTGTYFSHLPGYVTSNDNTIIAGTYHYNFSQESFFFITKFDSAGNSLWFKQTSLGISTASWADVPVEINGNYYIMATLDTPMGNTLVPHLYKINSEGDLIWHAQYDFWTELAQASFKSSEGLFTFIGRKDTIPVQLSLIVEIDTTGYLVRNQVFTNPSIAQQCFFFQGFEPNSNEKIISGFGGGGTLLARLDSSLNASCFSESILINSPNFYVDTLLHAGNVGTSLFSYTDITNGFFVTALSSTSEDWCNLVWTQEILASEAISLFPNPVSETLYIKGNTIKSTAAEISIYNVIGEKIYTTSFQGSELTVDCNNFPSGIYFVEMTIAEKSFRMKFLKQ